MPGAVPVPVIATLPADWPAPARIRAFTTLRQGPGASRPPFDAFNLGLRNGDELAAALENRGAVHALAGTPRPPFWLHQVHGTAVVRVDGGSPGKDEPMADAAVTGVVGQPLAILSADCLPVLFCAQDGSEVGAAHAGWLGLAAGVLEATVQAMRTPPPQLLAWIGPCAGAGAYEVGEEVRAALIAGDAAAAIAFHATRPGHWLADLPALARRRLGALGLTQVFGGDACTISDPTRFYSHRRDRVTGRMASLIFINTGPGARSQP